MKNIKKSDKILNRLIKKDQISNNEFDMQKLWDIMKQFMNIEFNCKSDALLFQCGVYNLTGEELFHFDFTRQFIMYKKNEYDHMKQLSLTVYFENNESLNNLKTHKWSFDFESLESFYNSVESLPEFIIPMIHNKPISFRVLLDTV